MVKPHHFRSKGLHYNQKQNFRLLTFVTPLEHCAVCLSQWVVDFFEFLHVIQSTVQYIHTLHAFFLFFLLAFFFLFVVRCRSLLFHDDWTLMQFCIIFALCREQIFQLFGESNVCLRMQHFTHKFLYVRFPSRPNGLG